jgi:hypothetical protein
MDIVRKRQVKGSQGNAAADWSNIVDRAGSWQYGNAAHSNDIEDEGQEEDLAFGVPHETMDFDPPGEMMEKAKQMARDVMSNVKQGYENVKTAYRTGSQQTESMGKELEAARQMHEIGRQATRDVLPSPQAKGK